jgi:hypothetical protein
VTGCGLVWSHHDLFVRCLFSWIDSYSSCFALRRYLKMFRLTFNSYFDDVMQMNSAHLSYQGPTLMPHYYLALRNLLSTSFYSCVRRHSYYKSSEMCRYSLYFDQ